MPQVQTSLRTLRKAAGLTQTEAAKRLGVVNTAISQWENGRIKPRLTRLPSIAILYGVSISDLLAIVGVASPDAEEAQTKEAPG